jgi:Protein of unknown function (DUF998)
LPSTVHFTGISCKTMSPLTPMLTSRIAGYASFRSVASFLALLVVLYSLEPEFNPPHLISEYELGRFGYLMTLAFCGLGVGSLLLARALRSDAQTKSGRVGTWWLVLIGVAYIGAGIFAPNPGPVIDSRLHGLSGFTVIVSPPIVFTLLTRSLMHNRRWSGARHLLKWATIAAWLGVALFYSSIIIFYGSPMDPTRSWWAGRTHS